jgi:hypothetical protein
MPHMSANGPFGMVFEYFRDCFQLKDSTIGFPLLFELCFHIVKSHTSPQIALSLA